MSSVGKSWNWSRRLTGEENVHSFPPPLLIGSGIMSLQEYPFIAITPRSTLAWVLSMGQIELNCIHMLNWSVWNRNVFTFNCVNKKLYCCWTELFEIELFLCIKMNLALNNLQRLICHKTKLNYCVNFVF